MNGTLKIQIDLGHDLTSDCAGVAQIARKVASKIESGQYSGVVIDDNGNCVGNFWVSASPRENQ